MPPQRAEIAARGKRSGRGLDEHPPCWQLLVESFQAQLVVLPQSVEIRRILEKKGDHAVVDQVLAEDPNQRDGEDEFPADGPWA